MILRVLMPLALTVALGVMPALEGWFQGWEGNRAASRNAITMLLGDSRKVFSNHFYVQADVYFHRGYYPSVFDNREAYTTAHIGEDSGLVESANTGEEHSFMGEPPDWIARFGRRFFPSEHTHLDGATSCAECGNPDHAHEHGEAVAESERDPVHEMLPWLRMSVALDPQRVESYLVASFWLWDHMGNREAAEMFLRDGLRENPDSHELYSELGRLALESRQDPEQARHLWKVAADKWNRTEGPKDKPDKFALAQIVAHLALAEEKMGNLQEAVKLLEFAEGMTEGRGAIYSARRQRLQARIDEASATP